MSQRSFNSFNIIILYAALRLTSRSVDKVKNLVKGFLMHPDRTEEVSKMLDKLTTTDSNPIKTISARLDSAKFVTPEAKEREVMRVIQQDVFSHVDSYFDHLLPRRRPRSAATRTRYTCSPSCLPGNSSTSVRNAGESNRDSWGHKRIEGAAKIMESY